MAKEPENILEEGKKLPVPTFFKKDIEEIAKAACPRGIDLDKLDEYDFVEMSNSITDIDEAIEKGVIPSPDFYENLTDEQIKGLEKILKKAVKEGVVRYRSDLLLTNFVRYNDVEFSLCCGCTTSRGDSDHFNVGFHLEIYLSNFDKILEMHFSEI